MISKIVEKEKAIALRRQGKTYSEILAEVPVCKSTISLWLHSVNLAKHQKQRITQKRTDARLRAIATKRQQRIDRTTAIVDKAKIEIGAVTQRELWLLGTALYWAEGAKQNEWR